MADTISHSSLDSATEEYEVVNAEPKLKIPNNGDLNELERKLSETMLEANEKGTEAEREEEEDSNSVADRMASSGIEVKVQGDQQERSPPEEEKNNTGMEGEFLLL